MNKTYFQTIVIYQCVTPAVIRQPKKGKKGTFNKYLRICGLAIRAHAC
jgi:hypothetical protein